MDLNIHNVTKIDVQKVRRLNSTYERCAFYVRDIVVWDNEGGKFELTLFADERGTLALTGEGA